MRDRAKRRGCSEQVQDFFLEIDQIFSHVSPAFQVRVGLFQTLDLLVARIARFAAGFPVLGQLLSASSKAGRQTTRCGAAKLPFWPCGRPSHSASKRFFSATLKRRRLRFSRRGPVTTSLESDILSLHLTP